MQDPPPDRIWYLPHHTVENFNKPGKVRRVANAASKFRGQSLNTNLLTGHDLLNSLLGVFMRFRENPIAVLADIKDISPSFSVDKRQKNPTVSVYKTNFWRYLLPIQRDLCFESLHR